MSEALAWIYISILSSVYHLESVYLSFVPSPCNIHQSLRVSGS